MPKSARVPHLLALIVAAAALGRADDGEPPLPQEPQNLDFESPLEEGGWTTAFEGRAESDDSLRHAGARSLRLSGPATKVSAERALAQRFDATGLRGKRVQVTGFVRFDRSRIGLWISSGDVKDVDGQGTRLPADPAPGADAGANGWKRLAVRIDIPLDAETAWIGARVYFEEGAPVWIDDLRMEVCPEGTPLFDPKLRLARFENLDFERAGADGAPSGWMLSAGEVGDPMDDDFEASEYRFTQDRGSRVSGECSARLELASGPAAGCFVRQVAGAGFWRGKKVRYSVFLRWDDRTDVPRTDGPTLAIRTASGEEVRGALEWGRSLHSAWRLGELVVEIPGDAETIEIGFQLERGTLWLDAAKFEAVE